MFLIPEQTIEVQDANQNHLPNKNVKKINTHSCSHCQKSFPSAYYLKFHEKSVHIKSENVNCQFCNKSFSGHYYLKQHIKRMHAHSKPYVCDVCQPAGTVCFGSLRQLVRHANKAHGYRSLRRC